MGSHKLLSRDAIPLIINSIYFSYLPIDSNIQCSLRFRLYAYHYSNTRRVCIWFI